MELNVGQYDRVLRVGIGSGLLIIGVLAFGGLFGIGESPLMLLLKFLVTLLGAVLAVTGLSQTCPVYSATGLDTR